MKKIFKRTAISVAPEIKTLAVALENCKESAQKNFIEKTCFTYFGNLAYNTLQVRAG